MLVMKWLLNSVAAFAPPDKPGGGAAGDPPAGDTPPGADGGTREPGDAGGGDGQSGDDDGAGDGAGGQDDGTGDPPGDGQPPAAAVPKPDWKDKELGRKHRQLQEEKRERLRLQQELDDAKALLERGTPPAAKPGDAAPVVPTARTFTEADVDRAAAAKVAQQTYDDACNDTFNKGRETYKEDWDKALNQLNLLGGLGDGVQGVETMQGVLATDDPAKVLHTLGSNPDEYHRVMALPPARRLAEIVKLGIPDKKPVKKPSALDPPPTGIARRAQADTSEAKIYDPKVDDVEWYAIRQAQKKASKGRPWSLER